jgi:AsmA protein
VKADDLKLAQFVPSRPANEELRQLSLSGNATQSSGAIDISAQLNSTAGLVAGVPYQNLALSADYGGERAKVRSLNLNAFGGTIAAVADATLGAQPAFTATLNTNNIDLQQALTAQKAKLADTLRGQLTGEVKVSGRGSKFDEIKPTLQGSGQMAIKNGKLIGINLGAETLKKVKGIPGIETLASPTMITRHPALFKDSDTDLKDASLSFILQGPRMTTHDLKVASSDYRMLGDGWLDMDKNIDLTAHVLMSKEFSSDLRAEKKNVVYLQDQQGEIDIPVIIRGALPKPSISPDIQILVQRAATNAIEKQGQKLLGKFLGNLGGGQPPPAGGGTAPAGSKPANPLEQLKKLF